MFEDLVKEKEFGKEQEGAEGLAKVNEEEVIDLDDILDDAKDVYEDENEDPGCDDSDDDCGQCAGC